MEESEELAKYSRCVLLQVAVVLVLYRYLISPTGAGKKKCVASAAIVDLGKFLYFVNPLKCPTMGEALTKENITCYLEYLDIECSIGPCGRSTKAQAIGQLLQYMKSLAHDRDTDYVRYRQTVANDTSDRHCTPL